MKQKVAVIGLGYVGLPLAIASANSGYETIGIDLNPDKINLIKQSRSLEIGKFWGAINIQRCWHAN